MIDEVGKGECIRVWQEKKVKGNEKKIREGDKKLKVCMYKRRKKIENRDVNRKQDARDAFN